MTPTVKPFVGLPPGPFRCIVADPPWPYPEGFPTQSRTSGKWQGPVTCKPLPYPAMSLAEIEAMPVSGVADKDCRLWLWTTNRYLPSAFAVMAAWGFVYRQTMVWHKADGNMGGSVAPNSAEFLLVGVRGKPPRTAKLKSAVWKFPQGKRHSRKPEAFQDMVESVSPGPYLELFARRERPCWTVWGNEVPNKSNPSRLGTGHLVHGTQHGVVQPPNQI